ncbi:MAG: hypothetical protein HYZ29_24540 [Myxococcales bacterium]|nr:hypothetical protein [Myxococcales bacterium]
MRFLHASVDEAREREALAARVDAMLEQLTPANASEKVAEIHPRLDAEVLADGSIVVTPRGERQLRPLAAFVVERGARHGRLRFTTHRPPQPFAEMVATVQTEHGFDLSSAQARAGFSRGHLLELVVYGSGFGGHTDACALAAAERAAEVLLGERVLDDWIGKIDADPLPKGGPLRVVQRDAAPRFALSELPQTIAGAVEGLVQSLPDLASLSGSRDGWVLFEAEPEAAADYRAQDDVALASGALPELLKCFLEGAPFSSKRFVRGGAQVAYLKLDARGTPFEQRIAQRAKLEDALTAALAARRLGAVIGNGLGLRYAYVDLALAPGNEALALVSHVARTAEVSRRSWLQFCDSDLGSEWLGVWPDSPPPP